MRSLMALLPVAVSVAVPAAAQEVDVQLVSAADGTRTLTHELIVPASPEQVWLAVATVDGWRSWAVPLARAVRGSDRFETGYNPAAAPGAVDTIEQQWIDRDRPWRVSFRTTRTPAGFRHAATYLRVVSSFILAPVDGNATRVRLIGTGYAAGAEGDALIAFFREGNRMSLQQLHKRFASGPIDWQSPRAAAEKD